MELRCTACNLARTCITNRMSGRGEFGGILIVGEAPGQAEDIQREPFVGRSGKFLSLCLAESGLDAYPLYFTNAVKCRPPGNKTPTPEQVAACRPWYSKEHKIVRPKHILALGVTAVRTVLESRAAITTLRGKVLSDSEGTPVVATYHPAAVLYVPELGETFLADLKFLKRFIEGKLVSPARTVRVLSSPADLEVLWELTGPVGFDLETTGLQPYSPEFRVLSASFYSRKGNVTFIVPGGLFPRLRGLFLKKEFVPVIANANFDLAVLARVFDFEPRLRFLDPKTEDAIRHPGVAHSLESMISRFVPELWAEKHKTADAIKNPEKISEEDLFSRNALDAYAHVLVEKSLRKEPWSRQEEALRKALYRAQNCLLQMTIRGFRVDQGMYHLVLRQMRENRDAALAAIRRDYKEEVRELERILAQKTERKEKPREFNPASAAQNRTLLYEILKLSHPNLKRTPSGEWSVDQESRKLLVHPLVDRLEDFIRGNTVLSHFLSPLFEFFRYDGKVHTHYNITGAVTGRISSSLPNMQNTGKDKAKSFGVPLRRIFIPEREILVEWDWNQIELRVLAHLSQDPFLLGAFRSGKDLHQATGDSLSKTISIPVDRVMAKRLNFAILYGVYEEKIARLLGIPSEDAVEVISGHKRLWTRAFEYSREVVADARKRGYVSTIFGRRRYFSFSDDGHFGEADRQAFNTKIQSTAGDITTLLEIPASTAFPQVNTVHDSLVFDIYEREAKNLDSLRQEVQQKIEKALDFSVPLVLDAKIGTNWSFE